MKEQTTSLRKIIEEILKHVYTGTEHVGDVYHHEATDDILAAIAKRDEACLGEESNISYHIEGGIKYLHPDMRISQRWEEGYNKKYAEIKANLEKSLGKE